jgi:hypothetical protein
LNADSSLSDGNIVVTRNSSIVCDARSDVNKTFSVEVACGSYAAPHLIENPLDQCDLRVKMTA